MSISVILAHPRQGSFNHAIAEAVVRTLKDTGYRAFYHDLYQEGFDPILPHGEIPKHAGVDGLIKRHCEELAAADGIVIIHPNWWGQPPAILKGWLDRVLRPGVAYEFTGDDGGEGVPVGLLKALAAVVFNTSNTPEERERMVFGDPLERLWRNCVFELCGVRNFYRRTFRVIVTSTAEERREWLQEAQETVRHYFPGERS
jgi:putative NADPH-quinone reductase